MTGLRKGEIASLMPSSFKLDAVPPTLTVEARSSKRRRKDVLPLHAELVPMIAEWTKGMKLGDPLFPKLAKRRAWLMVKKDLERVGIPYQNEDGIANFHAAGRHTHITELLRNGASLPEARELARHSDVRMTMRYTHVGLEDQARAIQSLPGVCKKDIVRKPGVPGCHHLSRDDNEATVEKSENPCECKGFDAVCRLELPNGDTNEKWRRRESNPRPAIFP